MDKNWYREWIWRVNNEKGLVLKLKLQYLSHLTQRANSLEKTLKMGKIEGKRRRRKQRMRRWNSLTNSMDMNLNKLGDGEGQKSLVCCSLCSGKELNVVQ